MDGRVVARRFHSRVMRVLALRGASRGVLCGLLAAGLCGLAVRFIVPGLSQLALGAAMACFAACAGCVAAAVAVRSGPPHESCLAALDAASGAGGLFMSGMLPGAESWLPPVAVMPHVVWRAQRLAGGVAVAALFCLSVATLPRSLFVRAQGERLAIASLIEQTGASVAQLEEQRLLPPQVAVALSNELARLEQTGDASDPARVLEALDHIAEELQRMAQEKAETLTGERADMQAAQAMVELLSEAMGKDTAPADAFAGANELLSQYVSSARLPPSTQSNLLALALSGKEVSPASLKEISELLKRGEALSAEQVAKLCEMKLADASACQGGGSCTNGAACEAALARLLSEEGASSEAALALVALCAKPGSGGVSRGRGDAMLTWTDASTLENASFKEQTLRPGRLPRLEQSRLEGVSAATPEVPETAASVAPGALGAEGASCGVTPQAVLLPRHRETVKRFFGK